MTSLNNLNKEYLSGFLDFIVERQNIWYRKEIEQKEYPWTEDPVLQKGLFTNVFREEDRTTKVIKDMLLQMKDRPLQVFNLFLAQLINRKETIKEIFPIIPGDVYKQFSKYFKKHGCLVSSAMLPPRLGVKLDFFEERCNRVDKSYWDTALRLLDSDFESAEEVHSFLKRGLYYIGDFKAYEAFLTLTYLDWFEFSEEDFVYVGPGAQPGWDLLTNKSEFTVDYFREVKDYISPLLKERGFLFEGKEFTLRALEGSFCEYRKYLRIKERNGACARKYKH